MTTAHTTYTLLVTITHDDGAALSTDLLSAMIERGLEEGVRDMAGVSCALATALVGDKLGAAHTGTAKMSSLHRAILE